MMSETIGNEFGSTVFDTGPSFSVVLGNIRRKDGYGSKEIILMSEYLPHGGN